MLRVCKHGHQASMHICVPCSTIINDIFLGNISGHENNNNLVFAKIPLQCPPTCATYIFNKQTSYFVRRIGKMLIPYNPRTITFKKWLGYMGKWDQCHLIHSHFHNMVHHLVFYKPCLLHFRCVHVMSCNYCYQSPNQAIDLTSFKTLCFKWNILRCHGKIQCLLVYLGWNVACIKDQPCTSSNTMQKWNSISKFWLIEHVNTPI